MLTAPAVTLPGAMTRDRSTTMPCPRSGLRPRVATALAATLLLGACSGAGGDPAEPGSTSVAEASGNTATQLLRPQWRRTLEIVGVPELVGDVVIAQALTRTTDRQVMGGPVRQGTPRARTRVLPERARPGAVVGLEVLGLDVEDGSVMWRHPMTSGGLATGFQVEPETLRTSAGRDFVLVHGPGEEDGYAPILAIDPRNGRVVRELSVGDGRDFSECRVGVDGGPEVRGDVCGDGAVFGPVDFEEPFHWDLDTDSVLSRAVDRDARTIAPGLLATFDRPGEELVHVRRGRSVWRRPLQELFGRRATTDVSWSLERVPGTPGAGEVYVGSIGSRADPALVARYEAGERLAVPPVLRGQVVAFDAATGQRRWRQVGVDFGCPRDPHDPPVDTTNGDRATVLVCRWSGTTFNQKGEEATFRNLGLSFEALDVRTGETLWAHDVTGRSLDLHLDVQQVLGPDGPVVAHPDGEGHVAIDLRDGSLAPVAEDAVLLCLQPPVRLDLTDDPDHYAGRLVRTCDADGRKVAVRPDGPLARGTLAALEDQDGWRFLASEGRLAAYRTGDGNS